MKRRYTNVQHLTEEIFRRKQNGETNREIGEVFGLTKRQIEQLVNRENRRRKAIANGYIPRPKGRPRKTAQTEMELKSNAGRLAGFHHLQGVVREHPALDHRLA